MHGFLSPDKDAAEKAAGPARQQLSRYPNVTLQSAKVVDAEQTAEGFTVIVADGSRELSPNCCLQPGL